MLHGPRIPEIAANRPSRGRRSSDPEPRARTFRVPPGRARCQATATPVPSAGQGPCSPLPPTGHLPHAPGRHLSPAHLHLVPLTRQVTDLRRFWSVALATSGRHPLWVAPLFDEFRAVLGPDNPFWRRAEAALWVASRGGADVGRLAAIHDPEHARIHGGRTGFFGFFESVPDPAVARLLMDAALGWLRARGLATVQGPFSPNINEECGLLVEGFDESPSLLTVHNPPEYPALLEGLGLRPAKDLVAFEIRLADSPASRLNRFREAVRRRSRVHWRPLTRRSLAADLPAIRRIYNEAWERNWGAIPMNPEELDFLVARLRPLLVDGLAWLAECDGEPAGLLVSLPDLNPQLRPLRGRLLTPHTLEALPYLLGWRHPEQFRLLVLGVRERFRGRGIEAALFAETLRRARQLGYRRCEASWVLEDNEPVHRLASLFQGRIHRRFRIYQRDL